MKPVLAGVAFVALVVVLYLLFWPVPIQPVAWQAPEDRGLTGPFTPNDQLGRGRAIDLGEFGSPEDAVLTPSGDIVATTRESGAVVRISPFGAPVEQLADVGGSPLGIDLGPGGDFYVANAYTGIQRVSAGGRVDSLLTEVGGRPLKYADDLAVARDGTIYFTEASSRHGAREYRGSLEASLVDILEHGGSGYVARYDPATGSATILLDGLNFPNGIEIGGAGDFLLIVETGSYRILRYWLAGSAAGTTEVVIDNLPGFPDNINAGLNGRYWVGLVAPRNALLDRYSGSPFVRRIIQRLPAFVRPKPVPSSHVIAIDANGEVLMSLDDRQARHPMLTGALETRDAIFLTTLGGGVMPWIAKQDL